MKPLFLSIATLIASAFLLPANAQNAAPYWSLGGNNNTTLSNRIGTVNNVSLRIVTNNTDRVKIMSSGNVGIGNSAPLQKLDVAGNINIAKGFGLYMENRPVLRVDSTLGGVFLGNGTGKANTGKFNTAIGSYALYANTFAYNNTAIGAFSLYSNTAGLGNVATGFKALYSNTTGKSNIAVGNAALHTNTEGIENVALGVIALHSNTTGSYNTATGLAALHYNTTGKYNVAQGSNALVSNITGNENVAIGSNALDATKAASSNTAVGHLAGHYFENGWNNTFIGAYARAGAHGIFNSIALGNSATVNASNHVRIGNFYTTSIGGYATWTNISDGRVKRNIREDVPGLVFINKLKPVTYNLDLDAADKIEAMPAAKDKEGKLVTKQLTQTELAARTAKQQIVYTGFIAQDVEKAAKELNYNFSGVDAAQNEKDLYGLRYTEFVMPLVKAVQELSQQADASDKTIKELKALISEQQQQIKELQQAVRQKSSAAGNYESKFHYLNQNTPNPAKGTTRIAYTLPATAAGAQLLLMDSGGKTVQTITLAKSGVAEINVARLSNGVYNYALVVGGQVLETRRLTVVH